MDKPVTLTHEEQTKIRAALRLPAETSRNDAPRDRARQAHFEARAALKSSEQAARRHDTAAAKEWTEIAKRQAAVAAQLANTPEPQSSWEEEEAMRVELMQRIDSLAGDDEALRRWEVRLEIWTEMAAEAERTGAPMPAPMPPRPPHWTDDLPEDLRDRLNEEG